MKSEPESTLIEETWWEVTTSTGSILELPAPLRCTETSKEGTFIWLPMSPYDALSEPRMPLHSHSQITNRDYYLLLTNVVLIKPRVVKVDPERHVKALMNMPSRKSSPTSGEDRESPSDDQENRSGPSTGERTKRKIH